MTLFREWVAILVVVAVCSVATGIAVDQRLESKIRSLEATVSRLNRDVERLKGENNSLTWKLKLQSDKLDALVGSNTKSVGTLDQDHKQLGCVILSPSRIVC